MNRADRLRTWRKAMQETGSSRQSPPVHKTVRRWGRALWLLLITIAGLLLGWRTTLPSQAQAEPPTNHLVWQLPGGLEPYRNVPFVPGELLVGFHGEEGMRSTTTVLSAFGAEAIDRLDLRGLDGSTGDNGISGYLLSVPTGQEWTVLEQLLQAPDVAFATPNWLVFAATPRSEEPRAANADVAIATPEQPFSVNDPRYEADQWYLQRINASRAWSLAYDAKGFAGNLGTVQVAIVDSGIDVNHPEFRGRLMTGYNYLAPGAAPVDDYGHGTHVAGLLGAVANNAGGIAGVAPKVQIDARKVLNSQGSGTISNVSRAIREAADSGADIINLSLESSASNPTMEAAVKYAHSKGVLLIAAAGNFYPNPVSWPAAYAEVIAVAATNYNDKHATYSNAGSQIELAAPGGERALSILSTWPGNVKCRDKATVIALSDYCTSEGTSMAAAIVSGAAALIKSVRSDYTAEQIRQLLRTTTTPLSESATLVGSGRLDIHTALRTLLPGRLELSTKSFFKRTTPATTPYTISLRLDSPSLQPTQWRATLLNSQEWVRINNTTPPTNTTALSGSVTYGQPSFISLTITPTHLITGSYVATLRVDQINASTVQASSFVDINLSIGPQLANSLFFPILIQGTPKLVTSTEFQWEMPTNAQDRTTYGMTDNANLAITLPFTFTLRNRAYTTARISSEGFVSFPDTTVSETLPNHCMPKLTQPAQAIYGWWADLNPGGSGARVSTFPLADRFVIEFENVPTAGAVPNYRVTFQMVLYRNGDIYLNYLDVPVGGVQPPVVTIGIKARDGLFYNQVVCNTGATQIGYLPAPHQSLLFNAQKDLY